MVLLQFTSRSNSPMPKLRPHPPLPAGVYRNFEALHKAGGRHPYLLPLDNISSAQLEAFRRHPRIHQVHLGTNGSVTLCTEYSPLVTSPALMFRRDLPVGLYTASDLFHFQIEGTLPDRTKPLRQVEVLTDDIIMCRQVRYRLPIPRTAP